MRILEIVLDGFKSYASRTVISDFDEHFNAITGFNGSGKSNILDAICFVLGISSLNTVRVTNKQEYIYKNGQAGVSRANVTILFDNSDKSRCHEAYKKYDKISVRREYAVGGSTKCTINGTTVTNEKILQLFSMSGLNVNNANFLIMQGRITQVINMKPSEILSLVEETAGTNAYEEIRKKTVRLIEKKEAKLEEIDSILTSEVIPIMEQLKKENAEYISWREKCDEFDLLERKVKAAYYYDLREMIENSEQLSLKYRERIKDFEEKIKNCESQITIFEKQKNEIIAKGKQLLPEDEKQKLDTLKSEKHKIEQEITRMANEVEDWEKEVQTLDQEAESAKHSNLRAKNDLTRFKENLAKVKEQQAEHKQNVETLKAKLVELERGEQNGEDFMKTRHEDLNRRLENLRQEKAINENKIANDRKRIENRQKELKEAQSRENFDFTEINKEITALENKLKGVQMDSSNDENKLKSEIEEVNRLIHHTNSAMARFDPSRFACNYENPEPGFDRSRVKGRIISLIRLKDEKYAAALEAGAGGRLFCVVVDTDTTGSLLLSKKSFGNVSILPNNKTMPITCPDKIKQAIYKTFGKKAVLALDLLDYPPELHNTIAYVFGNFFICETEEIAEKISFDPNFRRRAVTLAGDSYNPDGTLSGGESIRSSYIIESIEYKKCEESIMNNQKKLTQLQKQLNEVESARERFLNIKNELDMKRIMKINREKAKQESSSSKLLKEIEDIERNVDILNDEIKRLTKQASDIEKELKEKNNPTNPKDNLMKAISKAEGDVKKSTDTAKRLQQEINSIECSSESASNEIQEKEAKISEISAKLLSHKQDLHHNSDNLSKLSEEIKKTQFKFESKSLEQSRFQEQISELDQNLQRYSSEKDLIAKDKSIILTKQKEMQQDAEKNLKTLEELERTHSYIAQMEREIGDFDKVQGQEKLEILGKERDRLSKRVNKKVSSTLDDHTKRYDSLISKKGIVANDKQKLSDIITELDSKKLICIQETWQKVDQNLGDIYSMLLPGATAKLDRIDGTEEFVGLEMKVAFNGDWKSNLGELSGGQRSLLALSFILALLKVNPAPIYILDEIDAALDMSHTQNIGMIFKTHFSQSQFIVVSLKEGMFTNANVLFKTQFIEGRSVVERFGINSVRRRN